MITPGELNFIHTHACIPEHLPGYVSAVNPAEPFFRPPFLCFYAGGRLLFNAFPLGSALDAQEYPSLLQFRLDQLCQEFSPRLVTLLSPLRLPKLEGFTWSGEDQYYRLSLDHSLVLSKKNRYMLNRASQQVQITASHQFNRRHQRLLKVFLRQKNFGQPTRQIFLSVEKYVRAQNPLILEACRKEGDLVGLNIVDLKPHRYAFYMFNITHPENAPPGTSDLLFWEMVQAARRAGKQFLNLGLGIHPGVRFFKSKWGGVPFYEHHIATWRAPEPGGMESLLQILSENL